MFYQEERIDKQWQRMTDQYSEVFSEESGTIKGVMVPIQVPKGKIPRYLKLKQLAYAMKDQWSEKLNSYKESVQWSWWYIPSGLHRLFP